MFNREKIIEELRARANELYPFKEVKSDPNPFVQLDDVKDDEEWIIYLYKKILDRTVDKYDSGVRNWLTQMKKNNLPRQQIEQHFRKIAAQHKQEEIKKKLFDSLKEDKSKKVLYVMPASERDVFLSSSLFRSIKEQYPNYKLIVATDERFKNVLDGNPYVDRIITYYQEMDNLGFMEGAGGHEGFVDICLIPYVHSQRNITYIHNGLTNIAFNYNY